MSNKILVVDDSSSNVLLLQSFLEDEGFEVIPTFDGQEAIDEAKKSSPALILLDVMMPKINGFKVLETLKEDDKTKDIPIIFISADKDVANIKKAKELGVHAYVTKPIDFQEILDEVKAVLK